MRRLQLLPFHRSLGATFLDVGFLQEADPGEGLELPSSYGEQVAEERAVRESAGLLDHTYRGILDLTGKDPGGFLQGLLPSRVKDLAPGRGQRSCFLTPKGKLAGAFQLFALPDGRYRMVFAEPLRRDLVGALGKYAFLSDVSLADRSEEIGILSVQGVAARRLLGGLLGSDALPPGELELVSTELGGAAVEVVRASESPEGGFDLWIPRSGLERAWTRIHAAATEGGGGPVGWLAAEVLRIEAGIPRWGRDCDSSHFPTEVGLEDTVTYDKCYLGQEILARMRSYGHANWRLRGFRTDGGPPPRPGEALEIDGQEAGRVTSSGHSSRLGAGIGLCLLRRQHGEAEAARAIGGEDPVEVRLVGLPIAPVVESPSGG